MAVRSGKSTFSEDKRHFQKNISPNKLGNHKFLFLKDTSTLCPLSYLMVVSPFSFSHFSFFTQNVIKNTNSKQYNEKTTLNTDLSIITLYISGFNSPVIR